MRLQRKLDLKVFAIVIHKDAMAAQGRKEDPRKVGWEYLLQRLERFSIEGGPLLVMHDEGETEIARPLARKARRAGGAGSMFGVGFLRRPFRLLLDDPVPKTSAHSYFVQLADLDAFAAFRRLYPPPPRINQIVPKNMWDELGDARLAEVNKYSGGPPGIVSWPPLG